VSWDNPTDCVVVEPDLLWEMEEKMVKLRQNIKAAKDMQKSCANKGRIHREIKVGDHMFLKVKAMCSSLKLGNCSKMVAHYCGPFEILERIDHVAYMFALPTSLSIHNVFHVSLLKKYIPDANHVNDWNVIQVERDNLCIYACILRLVSLDAKGQCECIVNVINLEIVNIITSLHVDSTQMKRDMG